MSSKKQIIFTICLFSYQCCSGAFASDPTDKDVTTTKHFHFPFVHVDTVTHKDGTKDFDVKAPFTKVHNPAGPNNAQVKAPFTKIDHGKDSIANNTKAPNTNTQKSANQK